MACALLLSLAAAAAAAASFATAETVIDGLRWNTSMTTLGGDFDEFHQLSVDISPNASSLAATPPRRRRLPSVQLVPGGLVLSNTVTVYVIYLGYASSDIKYAVSDFINQVGDSGWWGVMPTYYDSTGARVSRDIRFGGQTTYYSSVSTFYRADLLAAIVDRHNAGAVPIGTQWNHAVYMLILPNDATYAGTGDLHTSGGGRHCYESCGYHTAGTWGDGTVSQIAVIGNGGYCRSHGIGGSSYCGVGDGWLDYAPNFSSESGGEPDSIVRILGHELAELVSNPRLGHGEDTPLGWWNTGSGEENADQCASSYSNVYRLPSGRHANAHMERSGFGGSATRRDFMLQDNMPAPSGDCVSYYPASLAPAQCNRFDGVSCRVCNSGYELTSSGTCALQQHFTCPASYAASSGSFSSSASSAPSVSLSSPCGHAALGPMHAIPIDIGYAAAAEGGSVTFTTCDSGTTFDTMLFIGSHPGGCGDNGVQFACSDYSDDSACSAGVPSTSTVTVPASTQQFFVVVAGYNGASGSYRLTWTHNAPPQQPGQPQPQPQSDAQSSGSPGLNVVAIGAGVGVPVAVFALVGLALFFCRKRRTSGAADAAPKSDGTGTVPSASPNSATAPPVTATPLSKPIAAQRAPVAV